MSRDCKYERYIRLVQATARLAQAIENAIQRTEAIEKELCWHFLELAGSKLRARNTARVWIAKYLRAARERLHVKELKHTCESNIVGHLRHSDFQELLSEVGFRFDGDYVYAHVTTPPLRLGCQQQEARPLAKGRLIL